MKKGMWVFLGALALVLLIIIIFGNSTNQTITGGPIANLDGDSSRVGVGIEGNNTNATFDNTPPILVITSSGVDAVANAGWVKFEVTEDKTFPYVRIYGPVEYTGAIRDYLQCSSLTCVGNLDFYYNPNLDIKGDNYKIEAINEQGLSVTKVVTLRFSNEDTNQTNTTCTNECSLGTMCSNSYFKTCGNYDADSCLEWSSGNYCKYGCGYDGCNSAPGNQTNETCVPDTPKLCENKNCGIVFDQTCWEWVGCGTCSSGYTCVNNQCVAEINQTCVPDPLIKTCSGVECGSKVNNCGENVVCGVCSSTGQFCEAGTCKSFTCTDTDVNAQYPDGKNWYLKGIMTTNFGTNTDYCNVNGTLVEYYCYNSLASSSSYICPASYTCSDGKCIYVPGDRVCNKGKFICGIKDFFNNAFGRRQ